MNIAIIIGVCNYNNAPDLSACFNDAQIIKSILDATKKYDDILFFNGQETNSYDIKSSIIEYVKKYKGQSVEELFFYFSGHGKADEKDFYYITTDTSLEQIFSTSLQNSELDTLLRDLNPKLFVKIVDACNSGVSYIKGDSLIPDDANLLLEKSIKQKEFNKCYFMNSSQLDQSSYASMKMSDFTTSFISCIVNTPLSKTIRYKHIADAISDFFESSKKQKPFFVLQADMTEEFSVATEELIKTSKGIHCDKPIESDTKASGEISLEQRIKGAIVKCATLEETQAVSQQLAQIINDYSCDNPIINENYDIEINELYISSIPMIKGLAEWIKKNQDSLRLFAKPRYVKEEIDDPIIPFSQTRKQLVGFEETPKNLQTAIGIVMKPKKLSIPSFHLVFSYIYSADRIYVFSNYVASYPTDWGKYEEAEHAGWKFFDIEIKSFAPAHREKVSEILHGFEVYILTVLDKYLN